MVLRQKLALNLEQTFRITQMAHQITGNLRQLMVLAGEYLLPRLDHRIRLVPHIQVHRAVVGVDGGLDRIADVVGVLRRQSRHRFGGFRRGILGGLPQIGHLRVRIRVGCGVSVDDPLHTTINHRRVHTTVEGEVRGHLGHSFLRRAIVENLRFGIHTVGEKNLVGSETNGVQQTCEDIADLRTAVTVEGVGGAFGAGRIIEFPRLGAFRSANDRIFGGVRREVDARLVLFGLRKLALRGDARFEELRLTVGGHLVAVGRHHAVAMGVHRVVVHPVAAVETVEVKLSCRDHRILADSVHLVLVYGESVGEGVVLLGLLQLLEGRRDDLRVKQSNLRGGFGGIGQSAFLTFRCGLVFFDFHIIQAVGFAGGVDIALDVGRFHLLRIRIDPETLQNHRPGNGEHKTDHHGGSDGHGRHLPGFQRFGCPNGNRRASLQRMRFHDPHAEHHAQNGRDGRHDEGDRNGGVHGGVGSAGDAAAFFGQMREHAEDLVRRPCEHIEDQPDADLSASAFGYVEQTASVHRHGDADAAHQHVCDDREDDACEQQQRYRRHDEFQTG